MMQPLEHELVLAMRAAIAEWQQAERLASKLVDDELDGLIGRARATMLTAVERVAFLLVEGTA